MPEETISDQVELVPSLVQLSTTYVGVDRVGQAVSEKVALDNVISLVQNVQTMAGDYSGVAPANVVLGVNSDNGNLFYVNTGGTYTALTTNADLAYVAATGVVTNTAGDGFTIPPATTVDPGLMTAAQFDKLSFIVVSQAVDLDVIETDTNANTTKLNFLTVTGSVDLDQMDLDVTSNNAARVPAGGTQDWVLSKVDGTSYNFAWTALPLVNLTWDASTSTVLASGTDAQITLADSTNPGFLSSADYDKLALLLQAAQVPADGDDNFILTKQSATSYDFDWEAAPPGLPAGGSVGDIVINSGAGAGTWNDPTDTGDSGEVPWAVPDSTGATIGWVLKKNGAGAYDLVWGAGDAAANGIPTGGATDEILAKIDGTDYNAEWVAAPAAANGVPSGGSTDHYLTKASGTDFDDQWGELEIEHDLSPQLGADLDLNGFEIQSVSAADITVHSDGSVMLEMGDAAGVEKVSFQDSSPAEVAAVDSDGNLTLSGTANGVDLNFVSEMATTTATAHGLAASEIGKPLTDTAVVLDDTDYYATERVVGVLVDRSQTNSLRIAPAGDTVEIAYTLVDGGAAYNLTTSGVYVWWDDSADLYKAEPVSDAAINARAILKLTRDTGSVWEAVVL